MSLLHHYLIFRAEKVKKNKKLDRGFESWFGKNFSAVNLPEHITKKCINETHFQLFFTGSS